MWKVGKFHSLSVGKTKTLEALRLNCFYLTGVHCLVFNKKPRFSDHAILTFGWFPYAEGEARDICRDYKDPSACAALAAGSKFLVIESEIDENRILSKVILETGQIGWVGFSLKWSDENDHELQEIMFT